MYQIIMTDVKVSIVIACYNEEHYIGQCLDSLTTQTLRDIEIIVVNDGSTDASMNVIQQCAIKDRRITAVQGQHHGAAQARNFGMRYAHGKYISFFDADDYAAPDCYQIMYDSAEKNESDICVVGSQSLDNETGEIQTLHYTMKKEYLPSSNPFSSKEIPASIFLAFNGWAWDKLFLFSFLQKENIEFQDLRSTNDMLFVDKSLLCADSIYVLDTVLITHRINKRNSISATRDLSWDCFYKALLALKNVLDERKCIDEIYLSYAMWATEFIHWQLSTYHGNAFIKAYNLLHDGGLDQLDFLKVHKERFDQAHKPWYDYCAYIHQNDLGSYLDELWMKAADQNKALADKNRENSVLTTRLHEANIQIDSLHATCEDMKSRLSDARAQFKTAQNERDLANNKVKELQTANTELKNEKYKAQITINELTSHISDMKNSLHWKIGDAALFVPTVIHEKLKRK